MERMLGIMRLIRLGYVLFLESLKLDVSGRLSAAVSLLDVNLSLLKGRKQRVLVEFHSVEHGLAHALDLLFVLSFSDKVMKCAWVCGKVVEFFWHTM